MRLIGRESGGDDTNDQHANGRAMTFGYPTYFHLLADVHRILQPARYLEIGVNEGHSLSVVGHLTRIVGVDPNPRIEGLEHPDCLVVPVTSEEFFLHRDVRSLLGGSPDLVFLDGLHLFEVVLDEVFSVEALAHRNTVLLVHDALPIDGPTSKRDRSTVFWSGDVWKAVALLRKHRPDLNVTTLDVPPTGITVITGFSDSDSDSDETFATWVGGEREESIAQLVDADYEKLLLLGRKDTLGVVPGTRQALSSCLAGIEKRSPG